MERRDNEGKAGETRRRGGGGGGEARREEIRDERRDEEEEEESWPLLLPFLFIFVMTLHVPRHNLRKASPSLGIYIHYSLKHVKQKREAIR